MEHKPTGYGRPRDLGSEGAWSNRWLQCLPGSVLRYSPAGGTAAAGQQDAGGERAELHRRRSSQSVMRSAQALLALAAALGGCGSTASRPSTAADTRPAQRQPRKPLQSARTSVYALAGANMLSPIVRSDPALVYVPNSASNTVDVISQASMRIVGHFAVGAEPQHVTPSWDLRTLYVDADKGNSLTPIDPQTGRPSGRPISVRDPYNLYFTPDGRRAIVVAEAQRRLDFRDAHTMRLRKSLPVKCAGVDHMDFSATGGFAFATCEFDGTVLKVDLHSLKVVRRLRLHGGAASPQDIKLAPDGRLLYVADQLAGGIWEIKPRTMRKVGFLRTGLGTHGLYPSRDSTLLYASNRAEGSVSVISFATRRVVRKWKLPKGSSPDMGGVSADGTTLWLSGRYNAEVYAINTQSGRLRARIKVGRGPHGMSVWPQPGRYSLGHTGITR